MEPEGADRFIDAELQSGRMVDVIGRGEPAMMVCHWTGIHWNGEEKGFRVFQEVVRRLHARYDNLLWMKLSELARYWAAKELTQIARNENIVRFKASFHCPEFTVSVPGVQATEPMVQHDGQTQPLCKVSGPLQLQINTWCESDGAAIVCFDLAKGASELKLA